MKLDKSRSYAHVYGHANAVFEQGGFLFDGAGDRIEYVPPAVEKKVPIVVEHDAVLDAKEFLKNILKQGPLSKSTIFKTANDNNQEWENVKNAAVALNINKVQLKGMETWKLTDAA